MLDSARAYVLGQYPLNFETAADWAVALGEIGMPKAEEICHNLDLYSSVASCSSGVELTQAQIVLLGNKSDAAVMLTKVLRVNMR